MNICLINYVSLVKWNDNEENSFKTFLLIHRSNPISNVCAWCIVWVRCLLTASLFKCKQLLCIQIVFTVRMHGHGCQIVLYNFVMLICAFEVINSSKHKRIMLGNLATFKINSVNILDKFINFDNFLESSFYQLLILWSQIKKFLPDSWNFTDLIIMRFFN